MVMKRLATAIGLVALGTAPALAADMARPYTKAPAMAAPIVNWTGFYLGAMGGYASENADTFAVRGGFAGGTIGYNWQVGSTVFGLEADAAGGDINNSITGLVGTTAITATAKADAIGTVRGRIGGAFNQVLLYGTAGYAWADAKIGLTTTPAGLNLSDSKVLNGWTAGAGIEWMFAPHWSSKGEYLYRSFGGETFFANAVPPGVNTGTLKVNSGQVGVNYHF